MTNETPTLPELSAGFALRVLREADRVVAHRRRAWRLLAAGTAVVSLGFAGALGVRALDKAPSMPPVVMADARPVAPDSGNQADALDDLFPDAAPVERLDRAYLSGGADDPLAEDTADDDGGF